MYTIIRSGRTVDDHKMYSVLDRLSTISVYGVREVITQLTFKDKPVAGSEMEKVCFVQKVSIHIRYRTMAPFIEFSML